MNSHRQWMSLVDLTINHRPVATSQSWIASRTEWRQHSLAPYHCKSVEAMNHFTTASSPANQDHMCQCQQRTPFVLSHAETAAASASLHLSLEIRHLSWWHNMLNLSSSPLSASECLCISLSLSLSHECLRIWAMWNKYNLLTTTTDVMCDITIVLN